MCIFTSAKNEMVFSDVFASTFPNYVNYHELVRKIIDYAKMQKHGTSIVIPEFDRGKNGIRSMKRKKTEV